MNYIFINSYDIFVNSYDIFVKLIFDCIKLSDDEILISDKENKIATLYIMQNVDDKFVNELLKLDFYFVYSDVLNIYFTYKKIRHGCLTIILKKDSKKLIKILTDYKLQFEYSDDEEDEYTYFTISNMVNKKDFKLITTDIKLGKFLGYGCPHNLKKDKPCIKGQHIDFGYKENKYYWYNGYQIYAFCCLNLTVKVLLESINIVNKMNKLIYTNLLNTYKNYGLIELVINKYILKKDEMFEKRNKKIVLTKNVVANSIIDKNLVNELEQLKLYYGDILNIYFTYKKIKNGCFIDIPDNEIDNFEKILKKYKLKYKNDNDNINLFYISNVVNPKNIEFNTDIKIGKFLGYGCVHNLEKDKPCIKGDLIEFKYNDINNNPYQIYAFCCLNINEKILIESINIVNKMNKYIIIYLENKGYVELNIRKNNSKNAPVYKFSY